METLGFCIIIGLLILLNWNVMILFKAVDGIKEILEMQKTSNDISSEEKVSN